VNRTTEAALLCGFYAAHAAEALYLHSVHDSLWACHVACLWIAAGAYFSSGLFAAIGLSWLMIGNPLWVFDLLGGSTLVKTSVLTHLGGLGLGMRGVWRDGFPKGAWWKATLAMLGLVLVSRVLTPAKANVNLSSAVFPGFEKWFPTYPRYFVFLFFANALVFFLTERLARLLGVREVAREAV